MDEKLEAILELLPSLQAILGERYEVILHNLKQVEHSIVGIEGTVTGRGIGGPATDFLLQRLGEYGDDAPDSINYRNRTQDGRPLRSSTVFIRNDDGAIIGSLCVNQDLTDYIVANKLLSDMMNYEEKETVPKETFAREISEVMEAMVNNEIAHVDKPVTYMQKEDKLLIVHRLETKGIFTIRSSVEYVAERLGVSNFTIYNYLKEIRVKVR